MAVLPAIAHDHQPPPIISIPTDGSSSASRAGLLSLMESLHGIREQLRSLENQSEIENHEISQLRAQQRAFFADMDRQLRQLGGHPAGGPGASGDTATLPPDAASGGGASPTSILSHHAAGGDGGGVTVIPPASVTPPVPSSSGASSPSAAAATPSSAGAGGAPANTSARTAYQHAFNLLRAGRYRHAVSAFQAFLQQYPQDKRAAKAQYWVAETDYVERQYPEAGDAFQVLVKRYPTSKRVPNALLKMGYIAKWQGHPNKARATWKQLIATYPKSMAAQVARNSLTNLGPGT